MDTSFNFFYASMLTIAILLVAGTTTPWVLFALAVPLVMVSSKPEK